MGISKNNKSKKEGLIVNQEDKNNKKIKGDLVMKQEDKNNKKIKGDLVMKQEDKNNKKIKGDLVMKQEDKNNKKIKGDLVMKQEDKSNKEKGTLEQQLARKFWSKGKPISKDSVVCKYLEGRGILYDTVKDNPHVREVKLSVKKEKKCKAEDLDCLLFPFSNVAETGDVTSVQRHALKEEDRKIIRVDRKTFGSFQRENKHFFVNQKINNQMIFLSPKVLLMHC